MSGADSMMTDARLAQALAAAGQPRPFLDTLAEAYRERSGWTMLTLLVFDRAERLAHRVYTTDPVNYPTSAAKPVAVSDWVERVLDRGETFVANTHEEFRPHYVDWEKLRDLGIGSAVNYPVMVNGAVLGTVNLTAGPGFYTPPRVAAGHALTPYAALGFLLIARTTQGGVTT